MSDEAKHHVKQSITLPVISLLLGAVGLLLFPASFFIYRPKLTYYLGCKYAWIPAGLGFVLGLLGVLTCKTNKQMNSLKVAGAGCILCLVVTLLSIVMSSRVDFAFRPCFLHMSTLGKVMMLYPGAYDGTYPNPSKWCDQLLETKEVEPIHFLCVPDYELKYFAWSYSNQQPEIGKSHYAMNIYCKPDSSPDTVLLFETTLGWNRHGGPELLTLDNHHGEGCFILFNDGHVEFEKCPLELNWGVTSNKGMQRDGLKAAPDS
jgi:hypothetical protein